MEKKDSSGLLEKFLDWFDTRENHRNTIILKYFLNDLFSFVFLLLFFLISYYNTDTLNKISFLFIKFGSLINLVLLYYVIKTAKKVFLHLKFGFKGSKNGFKLIVWLSTLLLLLVLFKNQTFVVNSFVDGYNNFNFTKFNPFNLSINFSSVIENINDSFYEASSYNYDIAINNHKTEEVEFFIFKYINEERRKNGIHYLSLNDFLTNRSRAHSIDMVNKGYFSNSDLSNIDYMGDSVGEYLGKMPLGNVKGVGFVPDIPQYVAKAQVDSWLEDDPYDVDVNLLLDPSFFQIGVGCTFDSYETSYVCTVELR